MSGNGTSFREFLDRERERVDRFLPGFLPAPEEKVARVHEAIRYSLLGPGKRIRPVLCLVTGEALAAAEADLVPVAAALEMVHCYSLVHDDLPAMDDDDLRRGRPTCHVAFGEGLAILAGDALLTLAFETIASRTASPDLVAPLAAEIARAAGPLGMVGGQAADLLYEGAEPDAELLRFVHRRKTGALLAAAVACGAIAARAGAERLAQVREYGEAVGLAFQVADDILDVTRTREELGKSPGKDAQAKKLTYPRVFGIDESRRLAGELAGRACRAAAGLPGGERLAELATYVVSRER